MRLLKTLPILSTITAHVVSAGVVHENQDEAPFPSMRSDERTLHASGTCQDETDGLGANINLQASYNLMSTEINTDFESNIGSYCIIGDSANCKLNYGNFSEVYKDECDSAEIGTYNAITVVMSCSSTNRPSVNVEHVDLPVCIGRTCNSEEANHGISALLLGMALHMSVSEDTTCNFNEPVFQFDIIPYIAATAQPSISPTAPPNAPIRPITTPIRTPITIKDLDPDSSAGHCLTTRPIYCIVTVLSIIFFL